MTCFAESHLLENRNVLNNFKARKSIKIFCSKDILRKITNLNGEMRQLLFKQTKKFLHLSDKQTKKMHLSILEDWQKALKVKMSNTTLLDIPVLAAMIRNLFILTSKTMTRVSSKVDI